MKIETKYDIGQEVWMILGKSVHSGHIVEYHIPTKGYNVYVGGIYVFMDESEIFESKEELLKSL